MILFYKGWVIRYFNVRFIVSCRNDTASDTSKPFVTLDEAMSYIDENTKYAEKS